MAPDSATHLYLGLADGDNFTGPPGFYDDNSGAFRVVVETGASGTGVECPSTSKQVPVKLGKVNVPVINSGKAYSIQYGRLSLKFTAITSTEAALCTVVSDVGILPVNLVFKKGPLVYHQHIADSVSRATVSFYRQQQPPIEQCDFSLLQQAQNSVTPATLLDYSQTNNCLLNTATGGSSDLLVKWSIPGFKEYVAGTGRKHAVYTTRPLTYYAFSTAAGAKANMSFAQQLQAMETYFHLTLIKSLPSIDRLTVIQDPPAHVAVADSQGHSAGYRAKGDLPGAGFAEVGGRSIVWMLQPIAGNYHVVVSGKARSAYSLSISTITMLTNGLSPKVTEKSSRGKLSKHGRSAKNYKVALGTTAPSAQAKETAIVHGRRYGPRHGHLSTVRHRRVTFSATNLVAPLGLASATWHYGDGKSGTGTRANHRYSRRGTYQPILTLRDKLGTAASTKLPKVRVR